MSAQTEEGKPTVNIQFRTVGWLESVDGLLYDTKGASGVPFEVPADSRSVFFPYNGPTPIEFYRITRDVAGNATRTVVATAELKDGGPWPLLLFFKRPVKDEAYIVRVIPEDLKSFPAGSYRFLNLSPNLLGASLADNAIKLNPLTDRVIETKADSERRTIFCKIAAEISGAWKPVYGNNWAFNPMVRTLVIINTDRRPGELRVQRLAESADFSYLRPPDKKTGPETVR